MNDHQADHTPWAEATHDPDLASPTVLFLPPGQPIELHPFCSSYRRALPKEREALLASVTQSGVLVPAKVLRKADGTLVLLDGATRKSVADELKRPLPYVTIAEADPVRLALLVRGLNDTHKNLDESDRAMVAARMATRPRGGNQDSQTALTQEQAAKIMGCSDRSIRRAKAILETAETALIEAVDRRQIDISTGDRIAKLSSELLQEAITLLVNNKAARAKALVKARPAGDGAPKTGRPAAEAAAEPPVGHATPEDDNGDHEHAADARAARLTFVQAANDWLRKYRDELAVSHDFRQSELESLRDEFDEMQRLAQGNCDATTKRLLEVA